MVNSLNLRLISDNIFNLTKNCYINLVSILRLRKEVCLLFVLGILTVMMIKGVTIKRSPLTRGPCKGLPPLVAPLPSTPSLNQLIAATMTIKQIKQRVNKSSSHYQTKDQWINTLIQTMIHRGYFKEFTIKDLIAKKLSMAVWNHLESLRINKFEEYCCFMIEYYYFCSELKDKE